MEKEKGNKCDAYEVYADCGPNSEMGEAIKRCRAMGASGTPQLVTMKDVKGNECGYATIRVTCQ